MPNDTADLTVFFAHSGSVCVKAVHRTLMKLTPGLKKSGRCSKVVVIQRVKRTKNLIKILTVNLKIIAELRNGRWRAFNLIACLQNNIKLVEFVFSF